MEIVRDTISYIMYNLKTINIVSLVIGLGFFYPIAIGFIFKLRSSSLINTIKSVLNSIAILASIIISIYLVNNVIIINQYKLGEYLNKKLPPEFIYVITNSKIAMIVIVIILFMIIYQLIKLFIFITSKFTFEPILNFTDNFVKKQSEIVKRIIGGIFQIPKGICYAVILTFLLNVSAYFLYMPNLVDKVETSSIYNFINKNSIAPLFNSEFAKNIPKIITDSFIINDDNNNSIDFENIEKPGLVYYNGVTLEEGIKSDTVIDDAARSIAHRYSNTYDKGKAIYNWVGREISYDDEKAIMVMNNSNKVKSGAIETFYSKKGVCFDYACLFVAMCRANNIKVRLIVGEGYNGEQWISHAWNEIFIEESGNWINVDATFYKAGIYYNNEGFNKEHRKRTVVGQW